MIRISIRLALPLALSLAALALAACGSAGRDGADRAGSGAAASPQRSDEERHLALADCLRDKGLHVDSSSDGKAIAIRATAAAGGDAGFGAVFEACRKRTGWAPSTPTPQEQVEMRDRGLRLARCMRAHGVDMPDPAPDGRVGLTFEEGSPTFDAAGRACGLGGPGGEGGSTGLTTGSR